jgi:hypothetical protein
MWQNFHKYKKKRKPFWKKWWKFQKHTGKFPKGHGSLVQTLFGTTKVQSSTCWWAGASSIVFYATRPYLTWAIFNNLSIEFLTVFQSKHTHTQNLWQNILSYLLLLKNHVYIYKQGWKSIHKNYKACWSNCKHKQGKLKHESNSDEVEDPMLIRHLLLQIS